MVTLMDPNDPQEERVFLAFRRLQLPHLRDTLAAVLSEAAKEQWTYLDFLDQILRARWTPSRASGSGWGCRSPLPLCPDHRGV